MIIGYARVSSREQAENSHALEQQIERLKAAGAEKVFSDVESGSKDDRKSFLTLMDWCCSGLCPQVIVTRLDRLTRSLPTLRKTITQLQEAGVTLVALDDSIDTSTAAGKFQINILGALAEMEVDRLSERVRHGWAHLRDRKVAMHPPFGYTKVNNKHELDYTPFLCLLACPIQPLADRHTKLSVELPIEFSSAQIADYLFHAFFKVQTLRGTLRWMNETYGIQTFAHNNESGQSKGGRVARGLFRFSVGGLRDWLTNPILQGHLSYLRGRAYKGREQIIYNTHKPLITAEEARQIEMTLAHNKQVRGYGSTALKYPLSGLVFCGECRGAFYSMKGGRGKTPGYNYYFQCKNWRTRGCSQKAVIRMELAESAVIDTLLARSEAIANIAATPEQETESAELQALRQELQYYQAAPGGRAAEIVADLKTQIETFMRQGLQVSSSTLANRELLVQCFSDRSTWETLMTPEEKRDIYRALVKQITIRDGQVQSVSLNV